MVPAASHVHQHDQSHGHGHDHVHDHGHAHAHPHAHGEASPHPAQAAPWSILRMTMVGRLLAASAVCAVLWGIVFLAMR